MFDPALGCGEPYRHILIDAEEILESIGDAFVAVASDWRLIYVNSQAEELLSCEPGTLLGENLWEAHPGLVGSQFEDVYKTVMLQGITQSVTAFYPDHDRWYEVHVYPARYGISIYFRNVTDAKRAATELTRLAEESDRHRRVLDAVLANTGDHNYVFDLQARLIYANQALLNLWQLQLTDAVSKTPLELGYPLDLARRLQRQIQEVIETRRSLRDEAPFGGASGIRDYEYIFVPVQAADGRVLAVAGSTRDITDRKNTERSLRESAQQLVEADRRKDDFLATLAHELRNPLAPIRNGLEIMRLAADNPQMLRSAREMMERQLTHLTRLVDDLFDMGRIGAGKVELRKERVDLGAILQRAIEMSRPAIERHHQQLTVELPSQPIEINADLTRLAQVFANLLNNAAKFTPAHGRIHLAARREGSSVRVTVKDNGIGIAAEQLPRIFDLFVQGDAPIDRTGGGLGIGLSLVRGLVSLHGGTVEAKSDGAGEGSEFCVQLPL